MVLSRIAAPADESRIVARRPHGAPGLLLGGHGWSAVRAAETAGRISSFLGRSPRRMDRIPGVSRHRIVLHPGLPLVETPSPVAPAESSHRHLRLYRCHSSRVADGVGDDHTLWTRRTVCCIFRDFGN